MSRPARLLTIAGSDSGGGAGIQADLKTFTAFGTFGMSALTAVTAQNTLSVTAIATIPPEVVAAQIDAVFGDLGVDAVKVGMLGNATVTRVVAERLAAWRRAGQAPPVVLDPVMVAKSGAFLLEDAAVEALVAELLPLATVVTPNLPEAARLTGLSVASEAERRLAAERLTGHGPAVLIKGGHGEGAGLVDLLLTAGELHRYEGPRIESRSTHGTGCTLSSAIAAGLALGDALPEAVRKAIAYLRRALVAAPRLGQGHGPLWHAVSTEAL
jgi:hydroxymethylpyrimidine/phosphomethylpyrimidine kinase